MLDFNNEFAWKTSNSGFNFDIERNEELDHPSCDWEIWNFHTFKLLQIETTHK